ncbi:MAG: bifunctional folylpolyglutamate synthase/dihydrofolate synthase [Spirochaetes bacterium]|jgi:dihydrofolate synthase/folylpolyglutamate synthase|nr:bifunctional folylpolyglutamate synthase/dihydrofolate synthase [Spirochaetota bacterium]
MPTEKLKYFADNEKTWHGGTYDTSGMVKALELFGNPHKNFRSIHIAGTNGKGSVAHMLNSIFISSGYKTGLYTSPHLLSICERIRINDAQITEETLGRYIDEIYETRKALDKKPTYFDVLTLSAFRHFSDSHVDIAVIETGLGGRLDSTNVLIPEVSLITGVSLDHTGILGGKLREIASEKAGIIKEGVPVIAAKSSEEVLEEIIKHSGEKKSKLLLYGRDFYAENIEERERGYRYDYISGGSSISGISLELSGEFQIMNSCLAITASMISGDFPVKITAGSVRTGIKKARVPGRYEFLSERPPVIFDPAHNPSACGSLVDLIQHKFPGSKKTAVVSLMKDKDRSFFSILMEHGFTLAYFDLDDGRCYSPGPREMKNIFLEKFKDERELFQYLDRYRTGDWIILFTGSFRLYKTALNYREHLE